MKNHDLKKAISSYFLKYLPKNSGLSENTMKSYRDTFVLYFRFCQSVKNKTPEKIAFDDLSRTNIEEFLCWLEEARNYTVSSRNQRLAAIRAFVKYLQTEHPEYILQCSDILNIKKKKVPQTEMVYLSIDAIQYLLSMPERTSRSGRRDKALITLLYDSGARVQELADLTMCDVRYEKPASVTLTGKGSKTRVIPIMPQTAELVKQYKKECPSAQPQLPLFFNHHNQKLTRAGITYILQKHVENARRNRPELYPSKVTPHTLRHSKGMHLLEKGVNLVYIRDFLGHESVVTTEIYAKANPEIKRKALEKASANILPEECYTKEKEQDLLEWLRTIL